MPRLVEWSKTATVFDHFYSASSSTQPSHASMFTSLYPWQHGVVRNGLVLDQAYDTVAERLRAAGFYTAAVIGSYPVAGEFGFDQGFDVFRQDFESGTLSPGWLPAAKRELAEKRAFYSQAQRVAQKTTEEIQRAPGDRSQFFWIHFFDPHDPYGDSTDKRVMGPMEVLAKAEKGADYQPALERARSLYDQDVRHLDGILVDLLELFESQGAELETHIILASDHGESFGADGSMGHGTRLTPDQIHVPCILKSGRSSIGERSEIAGSIDIGTTLLAFTGLEPITRYGRDLSQMPTGPTQAFGMRRMHPPDAKFLRLDGLRYPVGGELFFSVYRDGKINVGNADGLAESISELVPRDKVRSLFKVFSDELANKGPAEEIEDEESLKALRALGYFR